MRLNFQPKHWLIGALAIVFIGYCLFQARFLILGPRVTIQSHADGVAVIAPLITLSGSARNAAWISLNDRQIFTDEEGFWSEKLILSPGTSIMTVKVSDRFGREQTESIQLILN